MHENAHRIMDFIIVRHSKLDRLALRVGRLQSLGYNGGHIVSSLQVGYADMVSPTSPSSPLLYYTLDSLYVPTLMYAHRTISREMACVKAQSTTLQPRIARNFGTLRQRRNV